MSCLRCISGKTKFDKVRNVTIRKLLKQRTIGSMMRRKRLEWLGHVQRMDDDRWPKQMMYAWIEESKRPRGKPSRRWKDAVNKDLEMLGLRECWYEMGAKRSEWKEEIRRREEMRFEEAERKEETKIREYPCPYAGCEKMLKNLKGVKLHMNAKHPNACEICGQQCKNQHGLAIHQGACRKKKEEEAEGRKRREEEEAKLKAKEKMKEKEQVDERSGEKQKEKERDWCVSTLSKSVVETTNECEFCGFKAKTPYGLKVHQRWRHLEIKEDSGSAFCSSTSSTSSYQRRSKKRICPKCGRTCGNAAGLSSHLRWVHQAKTTMEMPTAISAQNESEVTSTTSASTSASSTALYQSWVSRGLSLLTRNLKRAMPRF